MKKMRVLLNGLGRIGRAIVRINLENDYFELTAINDINPDNKNMAYLLKYDCTYGKLPNQINSDESCIYIDNYKIRVSHESEINDVDLTDIDVVIEASGVQKNIDQIDKMAAASTVKRFIITNVNSKKAKNIIFGVNEKQLENMDEKILSSSICDAVSLGPIYGIIAKNFKIESGFLVTLHPWLSYQNLLDGPAKSWSQPGDVYSHYALGRASTQSLIPKSTSAIQALGNVFPEALDTVCSFSYRTPTQIVSSAVLTLVLDRSTTTEELLGLFQDTESKQQFHILETTDEPLISMDYVKNDHSAMIDTRWIQVKNGNHIELVYWYDNEWGYSSRIVDMIKYLGGLYS